MSSFLETIWAAAICSDPGIEGGFPGVQQCCPVGLQLYNTVCYLPQEALYAPPFREGDEDFLTPHQLQG